MAIRIPQYQQTQTPQGASMQLPSQGGSQVARAVGQLVEAVTGFAENAMRTEELYRQKQENDAKVEAGRILAETEYATTVTQQNYFRDLSGDPTGAAARFNEVLTPTFEAITKKQTDDAKANPYVMKYLEPGLQKIRKEAFLKSMGAEASAKNDWFKVQIKSTTDALVRNVAIDPTQLPSKIEEGYAAIDATGLTSDMKSLAKAGFNSAAASASFENEIQRSPQSALATLNNADDPRTKMLSADDHRVLRSRAENELERQRAKAEHALARRERRAGSSLNTMTNSVWKGYNPSAEEWANLDAETRGTEFRSDYETLVGAYGMIQKAFNMKPTEQSAYLADTRNNATSIEDQKRLEWLENALSKNNKEYYERPVEWGREFGGGEMATRIFDGPGIGDLNHVSSVLSDRRDTLAGMEQVRGVNSNKPLDNDEANALKLNLARMDVNSRAQYLGVMHESLGTKYFAGAMSQVYAGNNNYISAAVMEGRGLRTKAGGSVGAMILSGDEIVKGEKTVIGTGGESFDQAFEKRVGGSYPFGQKEREYAKDRTMAIYADLAAKSNKIGQPLDGRLMDQAVELATGGIYEQGVTRVAKPYGISDEEFKGRYETALPDLSKYSGLPAGALKEFGLSPTGKEGVYFVVNGGRTVSQQGIPLTVDLNSARAKVMLWKAPK